MECITTSSLDSGLLLDPVAEVSGAHVSRGVSGRASSRRDERNHTDLEALATLGDGQWAAGVSVAGALVVGIPSQGAHGRGHDDGRSVGQHALGVRDDADIGPVQRGGHSTARGIASATESGRAGLTVQEGLSGAVGGWQADGLDVLREGNWGVQTDQTDVVVQVVRVVLRVDDEVGGVTQDLGLVEVDRSHRDLESDDSGDTMGSSQNPLVRDEGTSAGQGTASGIETT